MWWGDTFRYMNENYSHLKTINPGQFILSIGGGGKVCGMVGGVMQFITTAHIFENRGYVV